MVGIDGVGTPESRGLQGSA